jgi:hypothetical protein
MGGSKVLYDRIAIVRRPQNFPDIRKLDRLFIANLDQRAASEIDAKV